MPREFCPTFWGSHGCDLSPGHDGDHLCLLLHQLGLEQGEPGPIWVWQDTGGWCNWWDGKEIAFLYDVCSMSSRHQPRAALAWHHPGGR